MNNVTGVETGFADLGLRTELLTALNNLGYEEPTPIQREAIPLLISGKDVLGQAATGTGKTAAFALPILHLLDIESRSTAPMALVLVPTRELAMQVSEAVHSYGRALGARTLPIYGGQPIYRQVKALERGVDVVVATPGRARDHIARGTLDLGQVDVVVLDEADEMLDMGFADDLEAILQAAPRARQTALFSATFPPRIAAIAQQQLRDPVEVTIARPVPAEGEVARVRQVAVRVLRGEKIPALLRLLEVESPTAAIVFCRTRTEVDELTEALQTRGARAESLHGGLSQEQRDRVMARFRSQKTALLVATDVAARGLDVSHVSHVVNFDVPADVASYVHRTGRTGRAGREGVAITLAEPRELRLLRVIEQVLVRQRRLPVAAAAQVEALLRFGRLIGNTDMHFGNLSLTVEPGDVAAGRFGLAPVYDMLPMRWRPDPSSGVLDTLPFTPEPADLQSPARPVAEAFWARAVEHGPLSQGFRALARTMLARVRGDAGA